MRSTDTVGGVGRGWEGWGWRRADVCVITAQASCWRRGALLTLMAVNRQIHTPSEKWCLCVWGDLPFYNTAEKYCPYCLFSHVHNACLGMLFTPYFISCSTYICIALYEKWIESHILSADALCAFEMPTNLQCQICSTVLSIRITMVQYTAICAEAVQPLNGAWSCWILTTLLRNGFVKAILFSTELPEFDEVQRISP